MSIPPRPWRVVGDRQVPTGGGVRTYAREPASVRDANGHLIVRLDDHGSADNTLLEPETAELIVRLVNAEPEIVAALKYADRNTELALSLLKGCQEDEGQVNRLQEALRHELAAVRAALAKVRP